MASLAGPLSASGEASDGQPVQVEVLISGVWTDITSYVMTRDGGEKIHITRGRRDEGSHVEHSTCSFQLNNRDGRFSPRNPSSPYYGVLGRNQQIRVSVPGPTGGKLYRFWGEVSTWPVRWDVSGNDIWVDVEAAGLIRRLTQGAVPVHSVVYDGILTDPSLSSLLAYWPCEDASGAESVASALTNGSVMTVTGVPTFASYTAFGASDALPVMSSTSFSGGVTRYDDTSTTQLQMRMLLFIPTTGLEDLHVVARLEMNSSSVRFWDVFYNGSGSSFGSEGTLSLRPRDPDEANLGTPVATDYNLRGRHVRLSLELANSGADTAFTVRTLDILSGTESSSSGTFAGANITRLLNVQAFPETLYNSRGGDGCVVGHITAQGTTTSLTDLGARVGPEGEAAGRRIERLCGEEALPFDGIGDLDATMTMGGQDRQKPIDLMREAQDADGGILFENLSVFGLGYRTRVSMENQSAALTLSYVDNQLSEVPEPVDDDQQTRNKITVSRTGGVTPGTAELTSGVLSTLPPPVGVGVYGEEVTLNVESDSVLEDLASWRLHHGTVDEARFPQIAVNLAHSQFTSNPALKAQALTVRLGDRLVVEDPPAWLPPDDIDQLVQAISETIDHFEHRITYTCSPASPWNVGIIEDPVYGRIDTDGSQLYEEASSTAAEMYVTTTPGYPRWVCGGALNPNPGFEVDTTGWTGDGATIERVAAPAGATHFGSWALKVTPDGVSAFPQAKSDLVPVTAGSSYRASGWFWVDVARVTGINVNYFDIAGGYLATDNLSNVLEAGRWSFMSATFTAPVSAVRATIGPSCPSSGTVTDFVWADDVILQEVSATDGMNDFPFDLKAGGELITAAGIDYRAFDDFSHDETSSWGTSASGDAWTLVSADASDRTVTGGQGVVTLAASSATIRFQHMLSGIADCEIKVKISVSQVATGAAMLPAILMRYQDTSNFYRARLHFDLSGSMSVSTARGTTTVATVALSYTYAADDEFYLLANVTGDRISVKAWPTDEAEPLDWQISTAITVGAVPSGAVGLTASTFGGNTNVSPELQFDDFQILDPQRVTVYRSVNGVAKTQSAGTDIRLAHPTIISL